MPKRSVAGTAADPTIQFAKLELDGETYKLAYSFNAIALAESVSGCNLLEGLRNLSNLSAGQLRGLFYAALSVADPKITIEQAGALIAVDATHSITDAIVEAYILSMPKKKEQDPPEAEPPAQS
jgi:hypothetical protein